MVYQKFRSRSFRFLLYPENPAHCIAFDTLTNSPETAANCVWIRHRYYMEDGLEDVHGISGVGKSHWHLYLHFDNARSSDEILKISGVESRFMQQIIGKFENAILYLTHRNTPEKEQYAVSDLGGADWLRELAQKIHLKYDEKQISMGECVCSLIDWIDSHNALFISVGDLARFAVDNGIFKGCSHQFVRIALQEHNEKVSRLLRRKAELEDSQNAFLNRRLMAAGFHQVY